MVTAKLDMAPACKDDARIAVPSESPRNDDDDGDEGKAGGDGMMGGDAGGDGDVGIVVEAGMVADTKE